jgi:hypothetical protein
MSYKGSDLSAEFKSFFRREKKRIIEALKSIGCTDIQLDYGFYFFSGFFTSASGQIYYLSCSDVRYSSYKQLMYRTAKSYKDYSGGMNQYVDKDKIKEIKLI